MLSERPGLCAKPTHHFVPNVKFSRLQRSLKKIHSEELDSEIATHHFGRSVQFSEEKCPASDLDSEIVTHRFGRSVQFSEGKCLASDLDSGTNKY